ELVQVLGALDPLDLVAVLTRLDLEDLTDLLATLGADTLTDLLGGLGADALADLLSGLDPSALVDLLGPLDPRDLTDLLGILDPGILTDLLDGLDLSVITEVIDLLNLAALVELLDNVRLTDLLDLMAGDLGDVLDDLLGLLPGLTDEVGVSLITTGPPFSLLRLVGVDVGWVPAIPSQIADAINGTDYLSVLGLANVRIPIVVGFGLGAFAAGLAYGSVVNALPSQPGGLQDSNPLASSVTLLPMILLRNPGRANGGLFARLDPLAQLFGFSTRTPDFELENSDGLLTGATLLPIKIDAAVEYDILSDFPAWPNPFSLLNSLMGMLFPTYMLRGLDLG